MQLRDLDYFIQVAETGSLRRAAQFTGVTQPAVTKGLRRLEAELGLVLVARSSQGAVLTEVGRSFLDRARRLRRDFEAAMLEANDLRAGTQGLVRVGSTPALVERLFTPAARLMLKFRPSTRLRVQIAFTDELYPALQRGDLDVVLSGRPSPSPEEFSVHPLGQDTLYVIARHDHPLVQRKRVRLADLEGMLWMLPRRGVLSRDWLDGVFADTNLPAPVTRVEFDAAHDGLLPLVLQSDILSVAGSAVCRRIASAGIAIVPVRELMWYRDVVAMTRKHAAPSPVVERFLELLAEVPAPPRLD